MKSLLISLSVFMLSSCATIALNDAETQALTEGNVLVRLEVTNNYDGEGRNHYDRPLKAMMTDDAFIADVRRFRVTQAVGRTSALGLIIKNTYFFIDDTVPTVEKGDIVDALYPSRGANRPSFLDRDEDEGFRNGKGVTIVRLVCKAKDVSCMSREKSKHDGKLTGVIFTQPELEGWPDDFSTVRVSPRATTR